MLGWISCGVFDFVLVNQSSKSEERTDGQAYLKKDWKALSDSHIELFMEEERTGLITEIRTLRFRRKRC